MLSLVRTMRSSYIKHIAIYIALVLSYGNPTLRVILIVVINQ